jgi:hypothetical protein
MYESLSEIDNDSNISASANGVRPTLSMRIGEVKEQSDFEWFYTMDTKLYFS